MEKAQVPRTGNVFRQEWRQRCRQALADHLRTQLQIYVDPLAVRLQPHREDGYIWVRQPQREYLFTKALAKHSVGNYQELYREVGKSITAIVWSDAASQGIPEDSSIPELQDVPLPEIDHLVSENSRLTAKVSQLEDELCVQKEAVHNAEEIREQLQAQLTETEARSVVLAQDNRNLLWKFKRLSKDLEYSRRRLNKALSTLCH